MTLDVLTVLACCILGLLAHGARHQAWLGWLLRILIGIFFVVELFTCLGLSAAEVSNQPEVLAGRTQWGLAVMVSVCAATGLVLFSPVRLALSYCLTAVEQLVSGQIFVRLKEKQDVLKGMFASRIFEPRSMPHLVALWIYITTTCFILSSIDPSTIKLPVLPIPFPMALGQLFSYNGIGLIALSLCGVGIFISRKPLESIQRLGWAKPTWIQVAIGLSLIVFTFAYDYAWSLWTHSSTGDLASQLTNYNAGTFTAGGGLGPSIILALFTGICAGAGEETLMRGALQPVFGILPAAILHGLLHGQFAHAPVFLLQVMGWSAVMGIVRRYTNTTTTIIGHAGFNFVTTFLFAFNP